MTNCMDKKNGSANIEELFSERYCKLYNSISFEHERLTTISHVNVTDITIKYCMMRQVVIITIAHVLFIHIM